MKFHKPWEKDVKKDGSYLKYEEGEVVPVESTRPGYPPYLNEEDGEVKVKQFKDMVKEEDNKEKVSEPKPKPSLSRHTETTPEPPQKKPFKPTALVMPITWLVILGGLAYYSVPIFQHFASETPEIASIDKAADTIGQTTDTVNNAVNGAKETVGEVKETYEEVKQTTEQVVQKTEQVAQQVTEGSGITGIVKENLTGGNTVDSNTPQYSQKQWLNLITTTQNQKQQHLIELQGLTSSVVNGQMSHSSYRLNVKGITRKVSRLQDTWESSIKGQNVAQAGAVTNVLNLELQKLEGLSVSLSSASERNVMAVFNAGVQEQNELTTSYKESFKALLDSWGVNYTEKNGAIVY